MILLQFSVFFFYKGHHQSHGPSQTYDQLEKPQFTEHNGDDAHVLLDECPSWYKELFSWCSSLS